LPYIETTALHKLLKLKKRIKGIQGGTSASKTISIIQILIDKAQSDESPTMTSITSESMPHLKRGAIRDFKSIMQEHGYWKDESWNATDFIYTYETGSKIEFFSLDMPHKVRGPRRNRLFINEANNIPKETYDQLEVRTSDEIWLDWNPTVSFWWHEDVMPTTDVDFVILTYKDNEGLPQSIVDSIESRRGNKQWFAVYGQGQLGEVEGKIYSEWNIIDEVPHEAELVRRGLDFGFSNDPSAIVEIYRYNGGYILSERLYKKGMHNNEIAAFLQNLEKPTTLVIADSSEPKSIDEIRKYGIPILGVEKKGVTGKSYLRYSIEYVQQQRISVTKASTNLIKEYRGYLWMADKNGKIINEPTPGNDHALDAVRYGFDGLRPKRKKQQSTSGNLTSLWARG
jgi:phage terminase large subunit